MDDGGGKNASGTAFEEPEPKPEFNQKKLLLDAGIYQLVTSGCFD